MRELSLDRRQLDALTAEILLRESSLRFRVTVTGSCMLPFIRHGDVLTVVTVQSARLRIGDIIVYRHPAKRLTAHRLVSKKNKNGQLQLKTRGDATFGYKEKVRETQLLGRVVSVYRKDKLLNLSHPCHRITALLWAAGSPVTTFILQLARKVKSFAL